MLYSVIFTLITSLFSLNQQTNFVLEKEYNYNIDFITTDQLGSLYLIKNSEIARIDQNNSTQYKYNNNLFGKISSVDASDPFRILIFNKDFNKITFLDNKLSEITGSISIDNLGFYNVTAVCQSGDGGFWIFDQNLYRIVYFNSNLNSTKKSSQFSSVLRNRDDHKEVFMLEKNDYIYLGIEGEGVLQFDSYGTYLKTFPIKECLSFQVIDGNIVYLQNEEIVFYNIEKNEKKLINLPVKVPINIRLVEKKIFIQTKEKVLLYQVGVF